MSLGSNIKKYRKALGFTQGQLGKRIGLQASAVSKIERGETANLKPQQLDALCELFGCKPNDLYDVKSVQVLASAGLTPSMQKLIAIVPLLTDAQVDAVLNMVKVMTNADI